MAVTGKGSNNLWQYLTLVSIVALLILAVVVLAVVMIPDTLRSLIGLSLHVGVIGLALLLAATLLMGIATGWERYRMVRAERHGVEHQSQIMVIDVPADHRAFTHEMDTGVYHNLSLDARRVIDGTNGPRPSETELRTWAYYHQALHAPARVVGNDALALPEPATPRIDILDALRRTPRGLIVGASDAGKSTVLRWLAEQAQRQGNTVVIDPHSAPDKWPPGCTVIGTGSRHDLIEQALDALVRLMVKRYAEIGRGEIAECGHPRVTIIVDEWMAIAEQCGNAKATLIRLLTESRKAAFAVYVGSHSDRVRSLGLDGRGDLRQGFEIYHLEIDQSTGARRAWLEIDGNDTPLALPGPYEQNVRSDDLQPLRALDVPPDTPLVPEKGSVDAMVCQMSEEGLSKKQISEAAWGPGKFGSFYNDKIDDILRKYQVRS